MASEPLISRSTNAAIDSYVKRPNMPLLIVGVAGSGKLAVAKLVSSKLLMLRPSQLTSCPNYQIVGSVGDKDGVEAIRRAIKRLSLKNVSKSERPRILLIVGADELSLEAQNTLLKTLEEPSRGSIIIMTSQSERSLLPTVVSRCVTLTAHPVSMSDSLKYYRSDYPETDIERAWNLANGLTGLLDSLLKMGDEHPLKVAVEDSKRLLAMPQFERLIFVEKNASGRDELKLLLIAISRVLSSVHRTSLTKDRGDKQKILHNRKLVQSLLIKLDNNANTKLAGLQLALNLKV